MAQGWGLGAQWGRGSPDEKSVMTEVDQFLKAYPEAWEDPAISNRGKGWRVQ